jgi:hypothetical protein
LNFPCFFGSPAVQWCVFFDSSLLMCKFRTSGW